MSEETTDKKVEKSTTATKPADPEKQKSKAITFVAIIVLGLLVLAVISGFLNNQKLNKQLVDLDRQLTTLQDGEKVLGTRVLALEDELVVLSLKRRLAKVKNALKDLQNLQNLMADNQDVVTKVQGLVDDLGGEETKLVQEISGSAPKAFQPSRTCPQPCYQRCPESIVIMHPPIPQSKGASPALVAAVTTPTKTHTQAAPKLQTNPDSWWSKFIHLRIFGN
ncbi:MAG: hypothetical protein J7M09_05625 [Deltaproteobacteria bacterium]|nr:hypothetical protein [Candidatus Tharpella sp.]